MLHRWINLSELSDEVAWELVTPLYNQPSTVIVGSLLYIGFGLTGYLTTGAPFYLVGLAFALFIVLWRVRQASRFTRDRECASPRQWAAGAAVSGWATGLSWGGWSILAALETDQGLIAFLFGMHAAFVTGAAVVNSSVPIIARGQILLAAVPLSLACLFSVNATLHIYSAIVLIQIGGGLALIKTLHQAKLRTLLNEVQASELSAKLVAANDELALVNQHLQQQVATDPLTGLLNRRAFDLAAAREWRNATREERPISIIMIDVDHFKAYNDHYGHQAGDLCLRIVADILNAVVNRPNDYVARYGGEEFIAMLPSTFAAGAGKVAERIVEELARSGILHEHAPLGHVSVSIGVAAATVVHSISLPALIARADQALYEAKATGRNRVCIQPELPRPSERSPELGRNDGLDELFIFSHAEGEAAD